MMDEKKYSLLIVDDEASNIISLMTILGDQYTVYAKKSGLEGIKAAEELRPNVILLDILMPDMDGYEVIARLKHSEKTKDIPVMFITGLKETESEQKGLGLGAADYITKPFTPEVVKLRVKNQIEILKQRVTEYDLMKHRLSARALQIGLWDMEVASGGEGAINPDNKFTWSERFREMLGFVDENDFPDLLQSWSDRIHPDEKERVLSAFATHINDKSGKTPYNLEYRLLHKNGEYRHYHAFGDTLRDKDGAPLRVAGALMDITEKKIAEEAASKAKIAEESDKAKSRFLANMSHEIRTPMNAILGVTEILMDDDALPERVSEGLNKIYISCDLLMGIINDILDFSKIEAGKLSIMPTEYQVASMINDSVNLNMMRISGKPIEFILKVEEHIPAKLVGDELRIKQILNNLLSNAFKYTDEGEVRLMVGSEAGGDGQNITLIFEVADSGHGMTAEQVEKLFDEYSRFNEGGARHIEGTGLGLAITRSLLGLMDAQIAVESKPGEGSIFTVRLPQGRLGDEVLGRELVESLQNFRANYLLNKKRGQIEREYMPYGSVLVVDDVETNLYVAVGLMKPYGLAIDTVTSGRAAINRIKEKKTYDVIFMDHMMQDMNGIEAMQHLRDLGYAEPIVALTADAVAGQAERFLESGFDAFVSKPIDIRQLNAVLNKMVRDKQPPEVLLAARKAKDTAPQGQMVPEGVKAGGRLAGKAVDGLDMEKGVARYGGDEDAYLQVLRKFAAGSRSLLETLKNFDAAADAEAILAYKIAVHGLKGACFEVFAEDVGASAKELEEAAKTADADYIISHNPPLLAEAGRLLDDIDAMFAGMEDENPRPQKEKPDPAVLASLRDACTLYSMDGVDAAMRLLEANEYTADEGLVKWLRVKVDMMAFDEIVERLG